MKETEGLIAEEFLAKLGALLAADFYKRAEEVMFRDAGSSGRVAS